MMLVYVVRKKALANSVDPDETPHDAASHQGLRCLLEGISCWNRILKALAYSLDPDETPQNVAEEPHSSREVRFIANLARECPNQPCLDPSSHAERPKPPRCLPPGDNARNTAPNRKRGNPAPDNPQVDKKAPIPISVMCLTLSPKR
ncbi:hypothetical protein DPMN_061175 [Dreissena polymorpha]|uniref:Uncharacterized protein n=1 Tax=Dreissena polymorpha TaxID=45954 RepID=A0A9D4C741_DREPO|nr:hypothetical protein DPMN_061175 [Dreissena polymorpha]